MKSFFLALGQFALYSGDVIRKVFSRGYTLRACLDQMYRIGVESLGVINLCCFFIGLVMVLQTAAELARFGAKTEVSAIICASFVREIGPVFAAIMFTGRIGTSIAAEIGSMVVTEQIDAYRIFGADPVARLAVPRVVAMLLMLPALTVIASVVGIFSGFLLCVVSLDVPGSLYLREGLSTIVPLDIAACITKGLVFGLLVGLISTNAGFRTARATEAVGLSTTKTMVQGVLVILLADLILTKIYLGLQGW